MGVVHDIAGLGITAVGCPNITTCDAFTYTDTESWIQAQLVPITNGAPGAAQQITYSSGYVNDVACPNTTTCEASANDGAGDSEMIAVTDGVAAPAVGVGSNHLAVDFEVDGLDCPNITACYAIGNYGAGYGVAFPVTAATGNITSQGSTVPYTILSAVGCSNDTVCEAVGLNVGGPDEVVAVPITNGVFGTPQDALAGNGHLYQVACADRKAASRSATATPEPR